MEETSGGRGRARAAVVALLVAVFGWSLYGLGRAQGAGESPAPSATTTDEPAAAVAERLAPSVVRIEHDGGQGSGVVYDDDGLILTAGHVVAGVDEVTVRTAEDDALQGAVVGVDPATDIAVVDVDADLPPAELSDDEPRVGQVAVAIGSPYGLDETVTLGIVSALDREVTTDAGTISGLVQTDAPINPGSSGGPLADKDGRVIGISHAIASSSGGNEGVGFAVPIDAALDSADAIRSGDVDAPEEGDEPGLPFPDMPPFGEWDVPHECFGAPPRGGRLGEVLPDFPDLPGFPHVDAPDVPAPRYVPEGWDTVSVTTNTLDGDDTTDVLHRVELASRDGHMTITLGNTAEHLERAERIEGRAGAESTAAGTLVEDGGRLYLVFDHDGLRGILDAPAALGTDEVVRIAESIR